MEHDMSQPLERAGWHSITSTGKKLVLCQFFGQFSAINHVPSRHGKGTASLDRQVKFLRSV